MQAGFDQSSLMSDPKFKQQETMQIREIWLVQPYFQANKMAAEKYKSYECYFSGDTSR